VDIDDLAVDEAAQVDGLAGGVGQHLHVVLGEVDQLGRGQGLGAQLERAHGQAVALAVGLLAHIAQALHRLQEAVDRRLGHGQAHGQVGDADVAAFAQCIQDGEHLEHRGNRLWLLRITSVVVHRFDSFGCLFQVLILTQPRRGPAPVRI